VIAASAALAASLCLPAPVVAQVPVTGYASAMVDVAGRPSDAGVDADLELRARVFVERRQDLGEHVRLRVSGYVEGLVADRQQGAARRDLVVRPQELYAEFVSRRGDVRVGFSRIVWGRLDELQPTDVVNPVDLARFFFEGRAEARLPVALARARLFLPAATTLEAVVVPWFRRGRFDQLDEPTSTFNPFQDIRLVTKGSDPTVPGAGWRNLQGGARVQTTTGRVDWGVSAYRGFRPFGLLELGPALKETYPRFTMLGADFETVRGEWGVRGEAAAFVDDAFQAAGVPRALDGRSVEAGLGADRKAGDFRLSGNVLVRRRSPEDRTADLDRTDLNLIAAIDRSFSRETRRLQVFGVYDPTEATSFLRAIVTVKLTDLLSIEGSGGWFAGRGPDTLGRFTDRDFAYVKVRRDF
jgi:hypothetical protein